MKINNKVPSQTLINRKKYGFLCSLLRGSSISANPKYLTPGGVEALNDLEREGICFLDKDGIQIDADPGDALGRYRMVHGKQGLAQEMADQLEKWPMSISMAVKSDIKRLTRGLNKVQRSIIPAAVNSSLNKAGRKVKTEVTRRLAKEMGLKQKDIKNEIKIRKSNFRTQSVAITATGRRLNIIRYKAKQLKKALRAKPWGKVRKWRTGFIGNRGRTAFIRLQNNKIKALSGPGIASEFVRDRAIKLMKTIGGDEFLKQFSRELKRRLGRL